MAPPPVTPTPRRFLVPKRSQPGTETPKPAFQSSSQQFQATPRFSLHSASRAAPSSSFTPFRRSLGHDVVIDSSPPPSTRPGYVGDIEDDSDDCYEGQRISYEGDILIEGDDVVQESSPVREAENMYADRDGDGERWTKRRRISVSPPCLWADRSSPVSGDQPELDVEMRDPALDIESSFPAPSISSNDVDPDTEVVPGEETESIKGSPSHLSENYFTRSHQPTFQKAPRFKPAEISEDAPRPEPLPDAFSPRRKGPKYVAGGLASELRNWLVEVEAGNSAGLVANVAANHGEEWAARIHVDELRGGDGSARGTALILGRQVLYGRKKVAGEDAEGEREGREATEATEATEAPDANTVKLILAGPGRLSGLGIGNDVRPGMLLGIARPTWEVVLDGLGRWGVACDWAVLHQIRPEPIDIPSSM
ncbi:hypothetical protein GGR50DRAFT_340860 [Xylaria sp. CBS 124048]|nr:hypothetical protein GGR50DRAFT_340860 [Xylaria sp. CBS 124048]